MEKPYRNKRWLQNKLLNEKLNYEEIANICNVHSSTIIRNATKLNLRYKKRKRKIKEGEIIIYKGRRKIKINGKVFCYARWLFEKEVRPLKPGEIVHQKDEDPLNDCIENYEVMTKGKHSSIHHNGSHRSIEIKNKISKALKGRKLSKNHIKNMRKSFSGRIIPYETRLKRSKLNEKIIKEILHLYFWKNITQIRLTEIYDINRNTINKLINGKLLNPNNLSKKQLMKKSKILRNPIK